MARFIKLWAKSIHDENYKMIAINKDCVVVVYPTYNEDSSKTVLIVKFGTNEDQTYFTPDDFNSVMERLDPSSVGKT